MEPNFELIVKDLFNLSKGEKVKHEDLWEVCLTSLDSTLGKVSQIAYPEYNVPPEVSEFIHSLTQYIEKNHIVE